MECSEEENTRMLNKKILTGRVKRSAEKNETVTVYIEDGETVTENGETVI